jgi:exodeoxyribonuclease V beta subunit
LLDEEVQRTLPSLATRMPLDLLEAACRDKVGTMAWLGLRTPLPGLGRCLADVPAKDCSRETEFLFGADERPDRFLTGFIDLLFRCEGRYYLLDWKTNLLEGYDAASLAAAMTASDYTRQYRLYTLALARWLRRVYGASYSSQTYLGGAYYVFLRGLDGTPGSPGLYFARPAAEELTLEAVMDAGKQYSVPSVPSPGA